MAGEPDEVIHLLERASNTAQRMDGVISGILAMATGEEPAVSRLVDLSDVLSNSLDDVSDALEELGFHVQCDEPLGLVKGDPRHIQRVFDNLIGNAVKYVRPPLVDQAPVLAVRATRLRRSIQITFADNGPGIPRGQHETLLSSRGPQSRVTAGSRRGALPPFSGADLGLGLPQAKMAMEACGGSLAIRTSSMGGTEFVLDFEADPCVILEQAHKTPTQPAPVDHVSYSSRTIQTTG